MEAARHVRRLARRDRPLPQRSARPPLPEYAEPWRHDQTRRPKCWPERSPHRTSSSAEPRARRSASPACAKDSPTHAAPSPSNMWSLQMQLTMFAPASESPPALSYGKTFPVSSATKGTPSDAFLARLLGKTANCSLQGRSGRTLVVCMDPKEQSRGGSWTPNISAWPNDAAVCSLSQVLETDSIPPRYFLSEKACAGILRRAEARRKTLPDPLLSALRSSADADAPSTNH